MFLGSYITVGLLSALWELKEQRVQKVFALAGKIKKGGLVEVPMGLTLRDVISVSAAASKMTENSRLFRWADRQADVSRLTDRYSCYIRRYQQDRCDRRIRRYDRYGRRYLYGRHGKILPRTSPKMSPAEKCNYCRIGTKGCWRF